MLTKKLAMPNALVKDCREPSQCPAATSIKWHSSATVVPLLLLLPAAAAVVCRWARNALQWGDQVAVRDVHRLPPVELTYRCGHKGY
jgi:hypothetical protein